MTIRLNKVTRDLNVGIATVVEFLQKKGYTVEANPNTKISEEQYDVLRDGVWQQFFTEKPEVFTREEKAAWLATFKGVSVGSDAFFPFGDNIERAHKSGVEFIAQPGGSIRDDNVIDTCNKYGIAMAFTGIRLFHH